MGSPNVPLDDGLLGSGPNCGGKADFFITAYLLFVFWAAMTVSYGPWGKRSLFPPLGA